MKSFLMILLFLPLFSSCHSGVQEEKSGYRLIFENTEALYRFVRYEEGAPLIIQGHRGTRENGLPENSIAAMEYVLEQIPAIFEIDPRLTRDSIAVVFHDATLDRTTDGTGRVADYTWAELRNLNLKNAAGEVTEHKIPSLTEVLEWAKDKTALILDKKDVPPAMIADMIRDHGAARYVLNMVRSVEEALFYYGRDPERMLAVSIREPKTLRAYMDAGIPPSQMFACIGTEVNEDTAELCALMRENGIRCLIATATSYDKLETPEERAEAYRRVADSGVTIIESNYPVEVGKTLLTQ